MQEFKRLILIPKLFSHFAIADNWSISLDRIDQQEEYSIFPLDEKRCSTREVQFDSFVLIKGAKTTKSWPKYHYQPKPWAPVSIYSSWYDCGRTCELQPRS